MAGDASPLTTSASPWRSLATPGGWAPTRDAQRVARPTSSTRPTAAPHTARWQSRCQDGAASTTTSVLRGHRRRLVVVGAVRQRRSTGRSGEAYVFRTADGGATYAQVAKLTAFAAPACIRRREANRLLRSDRRRQVVVGTDSDKDPGGLRLPHDRRRRHVRPGGQADGRRRRACDFLRRLRGDRRRHHRGRCLQRTTTTPGLGSAYVFRTTTAAPPPGGQADGLRRRGGRQLWQLRGDRRRHRRGRGYPLIAGLGRLPVFYYRRRRHLRSRTPSSAPTPRRRREPGYLWRSTAHHRGRGHVTTAARTRGGLRLPHDRTAAPRTARWPS